MSQYTNFFLKTKEGTYIPISSFGRSNIEADAVSHFAPYEKVCALNEEMITAIIYKLDERKNSIKENIPKNEKEIEMIIRMNNSIDEKKEKILEIELDTKETNEYIEELVEAKTFYRTLLDMIKEAERENKCKSIKYGQTDTDINPQNYIFVGIEAYTPVEE